MAKSSLVRYEVRGLDELEAFLKRMPHGTRGVAAESSTEYILGDDRHGAKHYPPYKRVTRKRAYGKTFQSDRQRRWFFANLNDGSLKIPYTRTNKLRDNWEIIGSKYNPVIRNRLSYAKHVVGDGTQSKMSKLIGWRTLSQIVDDNVRGAMRAANAAVQKWINRND